MALRVQVRSIRRQLLTLVVIPLASLIALWGFATYLTVGDGYRLLNQGRLITEVAAPAEEILGAAQAERRTSMVYLVAPTTANRATLAGDRALVDKKISAYRAALARGDIRRITPDRVMALARAQLAAFDALAAMRSDVDSRRIAPERVMDGFRDMVDPLTPLYSAVATFPDDQVSAEGQALQRLAHARELRARVDAVLAGALAGGHFTDAGYREFVQAVGVMRAEYHETYVQMTDQYRREVDIFLAKDPFVSLTRMEDAAIATGGAGPIPVDPTGWRDGNATALAQLSDFQLRLAVFVEEHAKPPAYGIFGRILVAGLLGLIAVIASVIVSLRIGRRLAARLAALSSSAHTLADSQLPGVIERVRQGEHVDVDAEAPLLDPGTDEIGEVGIAFNSVRRTAIGSAVQQAELRAGIRNVFLNIARRSQTLVAQQLSMLDVMERKTVSPEELADLFKVDHLATRMRRYAENLVILGGDRAGRNWGQPVAVQDVLRGAASEAEQYERVRVLPVPPVVLAGVAVSDVIHLVAELIDNATKYSPPHTNVQVFGQLVPHGFAIEVEDRGLGMSDVDLAAANDWLANPPEFNVLALSESPRLGMFVVARIAARHNIRVALRQSAFGGVTAIVLLPPGLVAEKSAGPAFELEAGTEVPAKAEIAAKAEAPAEVGQAPVQVEAPAEVVAGARPAGRGDEPAAGVDVDATGSGPGRTLGSAPPGAPAATVEMGGDTVPMPLYRPARTAARTEAARRPETVGRGEAVQPAEPVQRAGATERAETTGGPAGAEGDGAGFAGPGGVPGETQRGLPIRIRQAGLAPGLRDDLRPDPAEITQPLPARSAEEVRKMMSAYQSGTVRGRRAIIDEPSSTIDSANAAAAERAGEES